MATTETTIPDHRPESGPDEAAPAKSQRARRRRYFVLAAAALVLAVPAFLLLCNLWILGSSHGRIYDDVEEIVPNDVALVLGTSKRVAAGRPNMHFENRLEAAAALYKEGKVKHFLVSGDNGSPYYNEPRDMRERLIALGVPKTAITRDFAGFRTLDSVVRAEKVFGLERFTIVSDDFHVPRAVFLARSQGLDAVGLASEGVALRRSAKARGREWLARVKAVLDIYVVGAEPKFLGDPVEIRIGQEGVKAAKES